MAKAQTPPMTRVSPRSPSPAKPAIAAVYEKCLGELGTPSFFVSLTRQGDLPLGRLAIDLDRLGQKAEER
jgi:hypothetical protein